MTKVQTLLKEIDHLSSDDLELLLTEIKKKIDRKHKAQSILDDFVGKGKGVWKQDAQQYVDELRKED